MKYSIIILITQLLLWGCCRSERSILESFYKALDGDKWEHKENWLSDKPLNEWYGITTDEEGKVVKIQLSDTMTGKVPANLKHLKKLQSLHLDCMAGGIRLEVNNYPSLKELGLHGYINQLTVENCSELEKLSATPKYFDNFHIDHCPQLSFLELEGPPFETIKKTLDLSPFPKLSELKIHRLALDQLHINNCFNLKRINILKCQIEKLDLSSQVNLEYLEVSGNDSLHTLDLNNCVKLDSIDVSRNSITQLNISNCKKLRYLDCSFNKLSELALSNCKNLEHLNCSFNYISTSDIGKYEKLNLLKYLDCCGNNIWKPENNTLKLRIQDLEYLDCSGNSIIQLEISQCKELKYLDCSENKLSELDASKHKELNKLLCFNNKLSKVNLSCNPKLYYLDCGLNKLSKLNLKNNPTLKYLDCSLNNLSTLNLSRCKELEKLDCDENNLSELDITKQKKLKELCCNHNNLSQLNLSLNFELTYLDCSANKLSELDLSHNSKLITLNCGNGNNLTTLNLNKNEELSHLICENIPLKELNISDCFSITHLNLYGTQLTSIDISHLEILCYFNINCTPITTIWVPKGCTGLREDDDCPIPEGVECKIKQ